MRFPYQLRHFSLPACTLINNCPKTNQSACFSQHVYVAKTRQSREVGETMRKTMSENIPSHNLFGRLCLGNV